MALQLRGTETLDERVTLVGLDDTEGDDVGLEERERERKPLLLRVAE